MMSKLLPTSYHSAGTVVAPKAHPSFQMGKETLSLRALPHERYCTELHRMCYGILCCTVPYGTVLYCTGISFRHEEPYFQP